MGKSSEYVFANYDGGWKQYPEKGLSGTIDVEDNGKWKMSFGFRKNLAGDFSRFPFEVAPLSPASCRVTVRSTDNATFRVGFDLPTTPAEILLSDLKARGYEFESAMAAGADRDKRLAGGEWWAKIPEAKFGMGYHYSGAKNKSETGTIFVTSEGIEYRSFGGNKVRFPWRSIQDIEISTEATRRVTAGRVLAVGIFALAAKKNEVHTFIHISDPNTVFSFAIKQSQGSVLATWRPVLNAWNQRGNNVLATNEPQQPVKTAPLVEPLASTAPPTLAISVADELKKLAELRDAGVLSDEEFAAQKSKLLGS